MITQIYSVPYISSLSLANFLLYDLLQNNLYLTRQVVLFPCSFPSIFIIRSLMEH